MESKKLEELVEVISGQIMTRVKANSDSDDVMEVRKVIIPKAIEKNGIIDESQLAEESIVAKIPENRITREDDIVIKLNSPYDSAKITKESAGCVVPSFCAIIRNNSEVDLDYLLAFLNSKRCKKQLESQVQGSIMTILSVGKLKDIDVPIPDAKVQKEIGEEFIRTQKKLLVIKKIQELEGMKNDAVFSELGE